MMTKEQIENFPVGRELDALIMERVFGWKWFQVVNIAVLVPPAVAEDWLQHNSLYTPIDSPGELKREHIAGVWFSGMDMPFVSKEYHGDVFRLINHIAKTHWWLIKSPFEKNEMWFAGITPHSTSGWNGRPDFIGDGSTMALAVCRAALMMKFGYLSERMPAFLARLLMAGRQRRKRQRRKKNSPQRRKGRRGKQDETGNANDKDELF